MSSFKMKIWRIAAFFSAFLLSAVICCIPVSAAPSETEGYVNIRHNGKGDAEFFVTSDVSQTEFESRISQTINGVNLASGRSDMVSLRKIEANSGGYGVSVRFRRIDKVKARGSISWYGARPLKAKQSMELDQLMRWELGDVNCNPDVFYDGLRGSVRIAKPREGGPLHVVSPYEANGKPLTVAKLSERVSADAQVLAFQILDVKGVQKITLDLPGEVIYYGGEGVRIAERGKVEISPALLKASVTRIDPLTLEPKVTEEDVSAFVGYVILKMDVSPVLIGVVTSVCILAVGGITVLLVYFYRRGKRVIARNEGSSEEKYDD